MSYIGSGAYCYANSLAMALNNAGDIHDPGYLEVLTCVGVSAFWEPTPDGELPFFSSMHGAPDKGITTALNHLGYQYTRYFCSVEDDPEGMKSIHLLKEMVGNGYVIVGPLDMGKLLYVPNHQYLSGVDHFVAVYEVSENEVYLHDPAGYPYVKMSIEEFTQAWKAENIGYREGSYSMWGNLTKVHFPSSVEIFKMTDQQIASYYLKDQAARECVGPAAIRRLATIVKEIGIPEYMRAHLAYFSFQLGARRCSDFARFYQEFDPERAKIKEEQGKRFGLAHVTYLKKDYETLYHTLEELAQLEERFIELTLSAANA
jgi:hypothetical protein